MTKKTWSKDNPGFIKGRVFEIDLTTKLNQFEGCTLYSNFWIYSHRLRNKTEIDKLLVTPWGIYCIEAKSFDTALEGSFSDKFWVGWTGRKPTTIINPVFQNLEHCRALNALIRRKGQKPITLRNYVVVPDTCVIKTNCGNVVSVSRLLEILVSNSLNKRYIKVNEMTLFIKSLQSS